MDLLEQVEQFDKTIKKRLNLKGINEEFDTYRIPLNLLKYNKKNDRIATFITQYIDETGELPDNTEGFNAVIEEFIIESNPEAFNRTKNNIKALGQTEPAVVMSDGVIIDGNRRFTILRRLYNEVKSGKNQFAYLEAVILPSKQYSEKDIKRLELNLQHAVESKVDYNPIERLVGIYRDLIQPNHPFTIEEYADETQISVRKIKKEVEVATLLVEYLNYINQPQKFHIARKQKIDGPLREVHKILESKKIDEYNKDEIKEYLFSAILTLDGDLTRKIRDLKPIIEKPEFYQKVLEESEDLLDDINDELSSKEVIDTASSTGIVNIKSETRELFSSISEKYVDNEKLSNAKNQPIEILKKALERIDGIDLDAVIRFDDLLQEDFLVYLNEIEKKILRLKEITDAK